MCTAQRDIAQSDIVCLSALNKTVLAVGGNRHLERVVSNQKHAHMQFLKINTTILATHTWEQYMLTNHMFADQLHSTGAENRC